MDHLIIPEKYKLLSFISENAELNNNFNIAICGQSGTGKSCICEQIISIFLKKQQDILQNTLVEEKKIVYRYTCFDEVNFMDKNNNLEIFCKNNVGCNKLIYFESFDDFTEANQQHLKIYIDRYNIFKKNKKVFFLIKTKTVSNIKDIIRSRVSIYEQKIPGITEHKTMIETLCDKFKIQLTDEATETILSIKNKNYQFLYSFFRKLSIMEVNVIDPTILRRTITIIDYNVFDQYLNYIQDQKFRQSNDVLIGLYDDGYDIGDIYYFFYEYLKEKTSENKNVQDEIYFKIIERLCFYINEMYNGQFHKFVLHCLTLDIFEIYHGKIQNEIILY